MNDTSLFGWLVFIVVAAFLLRPMWQGFAEGLAGAGEASARVASQGNFSTEVVGESHYQQNLIALTGGRAPDGVEKFYEAELIREELNAHDKNAVRVDIQGKTVGYLSREGAKRFRNSPALKNLRKCSAVVRGGWDRGPDDQGHFGVWLNLS